MKQSKTAIKELTAAYRAVLRHAFIVACGIVFMTSGAMAANPSNPSEYVPEQGTWAAGVQQTDKWMNDLADQTAWNMNEAVTGWGVGAVLDILTPALTTTDAAIAAVNDEDSGLDATNKLAQKNAQAIETLNGDDKTAGSVAKTVSDAIADLDLENTYEQKGAAAQALSDAKDYADNSVGGEKADREAADTALGARITQETADRGLAVSAEATAREGADTALGGRIDDEATARETADTNITNGTTVFSGLNINGAVLSFVDDGAAGISAGDAATLATTATVMQSAENAKFTGVQVNAATADTTVSGALSQTNVQVDSNTQAIAANKSAIDKNTTDIAANKTNIALNKTAIDKNTMNIASNRAAIDAVNAGLWTLNGTIGSMDLSSTRYLADKNNVTSAFREIDNVMGRLDDRMDLMRDDMQRGFASAAAMSALVPNARATGNTQLSMGTGVYHDKVGVAAGMFHYVNDNVLLNAGAAYGGDNEFTGRAGITFSW